MLNRHLGLKGCELLLFAIIWSYTVSGKTLFVSESHLAEDLGYTREHVGKALRSLRKKGLITRSAKKHSKLPTYDYEVNIDGVYSAFPPIKDFLKNENKDHIMMGTNISMGCDIISHNRSINTIIYDTGGDEDGSPSTPDKPIPTIEEIRLYATETKSLIDPDEFYETCCRKDWIIRGRKVNDWRSLFDKWKPLQSAMAETSIERQGHLNANSTSVTEKYETVLKSIGYGND